MVEAGEDAATAVVREVEEETGIHAEVTSLVAIREGHNSSGGAMMSGKTNLFFVFVLRPTTSIIKRQESEIAKCRLIVCLCDSCVCESVFVSELIHHQVDAS